MGKEELFDGEWSRAVRRGEEEGEEVNPGGGAVEVVADKLGVRLAELSTVSMADSWSRFSVTSGESAASALSNSDPD